nr:hypothetical protein [Streptomyces sp. MW-W600-10]
MEAVVSLAMTEWRRAGYGGVAAVVVVGAPVLLPAPAPVPVPVPEADADAGTGVVPDAGTGTDTGTEKVAEAARSPGARSRTRSSSVSGPESSTGPFAGAAWLSRSAEAFLVSPFPAPGSAP